jgi:hypothetical protein
MWDQVVGRPAESAVRLAARTAPAGRRLGSLVPAGDRHPVPAANVETS